MYDDLKNLIKPCFSSRIFVKYIFNRKSKRNQVHITDGKYRMHATRRPFFFHLRNSCETILFFPWWLLLPLQCEIVGKHALHLSSSTGQEREREQQRESKKREEACMPAFLSFSPLHQPIQIFFPSILFSYCCAFLQQKKPYKQV